MGQSRSSRRHLAPTIAATAALVVTAGLAGAGQASAADPNGGGLLKAPNHTLLKKVGDDPAKPQAVMPKSGTHAFLLKLSTRSTGRAYSANLSQGKAAARSAAKAQLSNVRASQNAVTARLPQGTKVLYKAHAATNSIAVRADAKNVHALKNIKGVTAVYPISAKKPSNSYAVPLVGAPAAWTAQGATGEGTTIAIIDTGLDYTHANFGGPGTVEAYDTARADETAAPDPTLVGPTAPKIIGGEDFAGDDYDASLPDSDPGSVPQPDPNPLDCNGHGSHVGGTAAGFGENPDGTTYTGEYDTSTPFATMKIGPGVAPKAKLYGYRVFGCEGSSDVVGAAMDRAADPNKDGDPSDHVDVVNMSLGSDYGSALDGDAVQADALAAMGIQVVVASGNGGDLYEVGGSPGNAPRTLTVANSIDASSVIDALVVTAPPSIAGDDYGADRSVAYDWATEPDLAGTVVALSSPTNKDGCDPLSPADAAIVTGNVAFLEWTDDDTVRRCGSAVRSGNVANAGAVGFIFANDQETFAAGITGSALIPGVIITKSAGDTIRAQLGEGVTVDGTINNGFTQLFEKDNDKVNGSSSRNNRAEGGVKPDVAAVGTSVFSTEVGTGDGGMSIGGTSMATPAVAGLAALVVGEHPAWSVEEVKANIMNTAGQDLFTGDNHTGDRYAPNRVGAGRIKADAALVNSVVAYVQDDPGAVSVSFGPLEVTAPLTRKKTLKVVNKGDAAATYAVSYEALTSIPGVAYTVSPASVTVGAGETKTVDVTLTIANPATLTKTLDPTMDREQGGLPREFVADASGRVLLTPSGDGRPTLRVPVYSAPRPASQMTQAASIALSPGANQVGNLALTGTGVNQGSGDAAVASKVAAFELQGQSPALPKCAAPGDDDCVDHDDEKSADLKSVGVTVNTTDFCGTCFQFAITTHGPMHTVASQQEFDILIDTNKDGAWDFATFNTRLGETDVFVTQTIRRSNGAVVDVELINNRFGDEDTAALDSDTIVMPVNAAALGLTLDNSRIDYAIETFSGYGFVDFIGEDTDTFDIDGSMSFDALKPGITVGSGDRLLYDDQPGQSLIINRDRPSYNQDGGDGLLVVHFHNRNGNKAQVVSIGARPNVGLGVAPTSVTAGQPAAATVTVADTEEKVPTGTVTLKSGGTTLGSSALDATGKAVISFVAKPAGTLSLTAEYSGDATYSAGSSAPTQLAVAKIDSSVKLRLSPKKVKRGKRVVATAKVTTVNNLEPTGWVTLWRNHTKLGSAKLDDGKAKIKFKIFRPGKVKVRAKYAGNRNYDKGKSAKVSLRVF